MQISPEKLKMMKESSSNAMEAILGGNLEEVMSDFIENVIDTYRDTDSAKESIYKGFSSNVLKLLSDEGEIEASYVLGERYYKEGKIDEAVVEYEKLLDDEDERCVDKLINIYKEKAAEGNPLYLEKLGFELYRGRLIEKDVDKAIELLEKAEHNGSVNSKKYLELIKLK
jgi:TPR repeat protein